MHIRSYRVWLYAYVLTTSTVAASGPKDQKKVARMHTTGREGGSSKQKAFPTSMAKFLMHWTTSGWPATMAQQIWSKQPLRYLVFPPKIPRLLAARWTWWRHRTFASGFGWWRPRFPGRSPGWGSTRPGWATPTPEKQTHCKADPRRLRGECLSVVPARV